MHTMVPSDDTPDGLAALRSAAIDAVSMSVACAFVTNTGVNLLEDLVGGRQLSLDVCARGAPITEQSALLRLRDELGATVTAVMGPEAQRFHPKVWLVRSATALTVLSGSGNLTAGGLVDNVEQFELMRHPIDSPEAARQEQRLSDLINWGLPLDEIEKSPAWYEWKDQARQREQLARRLRELDDLLASRKAGGRSLSSRMRHSRVEFSERLSRCRAC